MEYDAEFQDQEGGDLLLESRPAGFCSGKLEFLRETLLGVIFCAMAVGLGSIARRVGGFSVFSASDGTLDVLLCDHPVSHLNVALRSKVQQEDQHDWSEHDSGTPGVLRPTSRQTYAGVGPDLGVCWVQEVNEGRGDDDTGAEVSSEEVDVDGNAESGDSFGDDWEESGAAGHDHDDEESGDAGA